MNKKVIIKDLIIYFLIGATLAGFAPLFYGSIWHFLMLLAGGILVGLAIWHFLLLLEILRKEKKDNTT